MPVSPAMAGYGLKPLTPTLVDDENATPAITDPSQLALLIYNQEQQTTRMGTGTWAITNGKPAYTWSTADLATAGTYTLTIIVTLGSVPVPYGPVFWEIKPAGKL